MGTIRYIIIRYQPNKHGLCQIRLVYQVKGKRKYFVTDKRLFSQNWNDKQQQAIYLDRKQAKIVLPTVNYNLLPSSKQVEAINHELV